MYVIALHDFIQRALHSNINTPKKKNILINIYLFIQLIYGRHTDVDCKIALERSIYFLFSSCFSEHLSITISLPLVSWIILVPTVFSTQSPVWDPNPQRAKANVLLSFNSTTNVLHSFKYPFYDIEAAKVSSWLTSVCTCSIDCFKYR
jgi:hypothetical protein